MHARVPPLWATPKHARAADAPRTTGVKWGSSNRHNRRVTGESASQRSLLAGRLAALLPHLSIGGVGVAAVLGRHLRAAEGAAGEGEARAAWAEKGGDCSRYKPGQDSPLCIACKSTGSAPERTTHAETGQPLHRTIPSLYLDRAAGAGTRAHLLLAGLAALRAHVVVGGVGVAAVLGRHLGGMLSGSQRVGGRY